MLIGAIADDFTGATDLALILSQEGMRVILVPGVPSGQQVFADADAVVIALKTRTATPGHAVEQSRLAASALLAAGARQLFFKYCSTFDSTDKGNIGPVIDALLEVLGETGTIACPSFPENGRTVYKGHLFVDDDLLSDSSMRDHPLTPMRDSSLVRLLSRQTARRVTLIAHDTVSAGVDAIEAALARTKDGIAIIDAIDDADLRAIGRAARTLRLVTGGSAVARGLPANFPDFRPVGQNTVVHEIAPGRTAVLAGSCSAATRRQIAHAQAAGSPSLPLDPVAMANGRQTPAEALAFILRSPENRLPVAYSSIDPARLEATQKRLGREEAGALVENFIAELAAMLVEHDVNRLIVAGGETSGAVVKRLHPPALRIGREIAPGVPWTVSAIAGKTVALALKSGNFGTDDFFRKAADMLP